MIRALLFACVVFAALAYPRAANATSCTVPNLVVNGQYVDATKLAANFSALAACSSNIDNTNIGAAGIYASQLIPTTVAQAVFGGSQTYTFSNGLNVTGALAVTGAVSGASGAFTSAVSAGNGFTTTGTDNAGGLIVSGTTSSGQLSVSGQSNLNGLSAASPSFTGTVSSVAISNSGLVATGSFNDSGAAVFGSSGYVQVSSLTPSQCVNTASNDVLGSQPCNYFTLNGLQPTVSLTSTGNTISITPSGSTIDLENLYTYTLPSSVVKSNTSNNEVMVHGTATANNAGSTVGGLPYTSSSTYDCTITPTGTSSQTWTPILSKTNGATITLYNNPSITVTYICLGH
jgi:hypothetical protein